MKKLILNILALCLMVGCTVRTAPSPREQHADEFSDAGLMKIVRTVRAWEDAYAHVAPADSSYAQRLNRITAPHNNVNGIPLNYKVYISPEITANAFADGSIRIHSGIMDLMNDDELRFVLGYLMGTIAHADQIRTMRLNQLVALWNAQKMLSKIWNLPWKPEDSKKLTSLRQEQAGLLRKQVLAADDYAMAFLRANGYNNRAAMTAMRKLERITTNAGNALPGFPSVDIRIKRMEKALAAP